MLKRIIAVALVAGLGGLALMAATPAAPSSPVQGSTVQVQVNLTCSGTGVQFSIDPWVVQIGQDDQVEWVLNPGADSDSVEVVPKTGRWPFQQQAHRGNKQDPARSGAVRQGQVGRFQYNIRLTCNQGQSFDVVIDPDIIIN